MAKLIELLFDALQKYPEMEDKKVKDTMTLISTKILSKVKALRGEPVACDLLKRYQGEGKVLTKMIKIFVFTVLDIFRSRSGSIFAGIDFVAVHVRSSTSQTQTSREIATSEMGKS